MNAPVWHAGPWVRLCADAEANRLPHALLLQGPVGVGKRAIAERLVARLMCTDLQDGEACDQCPGCRLRMAGTHPDLYRVSLSTNREGKFRGEIVVDQIRGTCERLMLASQLGGWRIALVDPADALNPASANALLKTLEEPPEDALLLLVADHPERLPATVRSRCRRVAIRLPASADALEWLRTQGLSGDCGQALDAADGSPGRAAQLLRDGMLSRREAVRSELAQLLAQRADPLALAQAWSQDEPRQRLLFAAQWLAREARAEATRQRGPLASGREIAVLTRWFEQANAAREMLRGPVRAEPILLDFLGLRAVAA